MNSTGKNYFEEKLDFGEKFILDFNELYQFEFPLDERIELQVNHENVKYEFLVRIASNNENLICFGNGAIDRTKLPLPYYSRHSWYTQFEESIIIYNDPTLYLDDNFRLGWGVGKNESWYLRIIANIIKIITTKNNILLENTVFFGASGGGFTSIMLATLLKKSMAIANNPQINAQKNVYFEEMISVCFDNLDLDSILELYGHRFDVIKCFKKENYVPPLTYIVNIGERTDIMDQLLPFIEGLRPFKSLNEQINIVLYYNDEGHHGILTFKEVIELLKNHFDQKFKNSYEFKIKHDLPVISGTVGEITKNRIIEQKIKIPKYLGVWGNEKMHIEVLFATFKRDNKGKIEISLKQDNVMEKVQIYTSEIKDNVYKKITFNSSSFKKGNALLTLKGIDGKNGNSVTVYLTKDSELGGVIVDGNRLMENLIIKSYVL